jgi:hypothetical protein
VLHVTEPASTCCLCPEPSIDSLQRLRQTDADERRPRAPLCVQHRREVIAEVTNLGYCGIGGHYGKSAGYCYKHSQAMVVG